MSGAASPLVERAIKAAAAKMPSKIGASISPLDVLNAIIAALDACQVEATHEALKFAHAHILELRDAWERGAISEHDGRGSTRSNRNVDVEVQLRALLAELDGRP